MTLFSLNVSCGILSSFPFYLCLVFTELGGSWGPIKPTETLHVRLACDDKVPSYLDPLNHEHMNYDIWRPKSFFIVECHWKGFRFISLIFYDNQTGLTIYKIIYLCSNYRKPLLVIIC